MGWMDEYNKALKKYKKKDEEQTTPKSTTSTKTTSKSSGSTWMQEYERSLAKYEAQEAEKEEKKAADKITVGRLTSPQEEKEDKRSWFQKGVFEDGYQVGDISKAILGTLSDVGQDALTGIVGMGESAVDAFMTIAPYSMQSNNPYMTPAMREQQDRIIAQAKKESAEFVAKDLYDEEAVAKQILANVAGNMGNVQKVQGGQYLTEEDLALGRENTKYAQQYLDNQMEAESVLGERTDALMQSAGVLAAQAGLQAVGVPWYLTSGVTSFGSESENALKQGATHEEAIMSGAISAGAEILTEKMFGGDIFTKNGADLATKYLSRNVSNKIVRNLLKAGYDVAGEGFEEAVSQVVSRLGSSLYKDETLKEILTSEEALDEYLESAIGGMVLGGAMTGINVAKSNAAGVDFTTGLTENEQKVVDKLYKEYQTEDMDSQEKKKLYDDVLRGMDRGTIDADTIAEILDSDSHKAYDSLTKESEEFKTLYETPFEKLSAQQNDRLKELQAKHEAKKYETALEEARNKRFTDTWDMVRGTRLEESFREKLRVNEDFKADFDRFKGTKHEEAARKTLQSALDFVSKEGKKLNNTNAMHDVIDLAAQIASETGKVFYVKDGESIKQEFIKRQTEEISKLENLKKRTAEQDEILAKMKGILSDVESGKTKVNGDITADGITLNLDSENPLIFTTGHEVTHSLEQAKAYDKLRDALFSYAKAKNVDIDSELTDRKARYAGIKDADPEKELVADLVGDYVFNDYDFIHNLSTNHRNVFQKVYDEIKHLCKLATAGSKAARDLERVKRQFEKAYREAAETSKAKTDTTKHSISDSTGRQLTKEQADYFKDSKARDENGNLIPVYHGSKNSGFNIFQYSKDVQTGTDYGEAYYFTSDRQKASGYSYDVTKDERVAKYNADREALKNRFLETRSEEDKNAFLNYRYDGKKLADLIDDESYNTEGGEVKEVYLNLTNPLIVDAGGKYYYEVYQDYFDKARANGNDGIIVKNVIDNPRGEARPIDTYIAFSQNQIKNVDNAKPTQNPDIRYSLSDSDGKQLTKEQQDYFKDSKMRDENGNLKVMYHGSQDAGFHVFDGKFSDDDISFFFVDSNDVAASYSGTTETYEAKTIRNADDMRNFLQSIGYEGYEVFEEGENHWIEQDGDYVAGGKTWQELYDEFCWYEGIGEGDANYKVYLNLKNPLEVDAQGRNWNNISREFSQEVYDRYQSLTDAEKAALVDLAEWGDYGVFRDEMLTYARAIADGTLDDTASALSSAYAKLGGANANLHDAFTIASDNFSEDTLREFAVKQMKTRDYAQRAKAEGYDGVIFKNIHDNGGYSNGSEGASTVAIAFESNQIKSTANESPTEHKDIRYSLSNAETDKNYLDAVNSGDTETARKIMEQVAKRRGYTIHAYHGTARGDRVGNVFLPERATSGPMAFFTDNREIAENYSKSKQDTSMAYDPDYDRYETQFRIKTKYQDIPLYRAWGYLPFDARNRITKKAGQLRENWDGDYELMLDPDTNEGNGGFQWQLKEARGNAIQALTEQWLNSGTLFNEESRFLDVLEMAGVTEEFRKIGMDSLYFKDPNAKHEKVYDTFLRIKRPFDTANVDEQFISDLESWYEEQDQSKYVRENMESDLWDKNGIDAYDFADRLRSDLENNTTHAWTSIPDSVTDYLKHLGYDGIKDTGGKFSGDLHTVWIPFASSQIKSAETVTYDDAGNVIPITERFDKKDVDIRHSLYTKPFSRSINDVYGKDVIKQNPFGEIAPIVDPNNQPSKAWTVEEMFPDEQIQSEMERLDAARAQIYGALESALEHGTANEVEQLAAEYDSYTARIRELENGISEAENGRTDSLMGEEAPPEMDAPYYETEPTVLTKKATADIVRDVRKSLDLTNPQMADCKDIIERWRSGAIQTREQLVDSLRDKFGKYTDIEEDYLLQEIKREIRTRGINVSKAVQRNFPDYVDLMRRNRGKIRFSKQGLAVDEVYQELNSMYPDYFPMEMYTDKGKQNAADQLERIIEVANTPHIKETQRNKAIENIEEAADIIIKGIDNFRRNQDLALSERESKSAFADLVRNADRYAPEDIAPVLTKPFSQSKATNPTKVAPTKVTPQKPSGKVAEVLSKASKPDKKTGFGMGVISQTVDKGMAVENLAYETGNEELQPKYQAALPSTTEAKAQYFMENGADGVKPFKETVQEITKSGKQNDFERYMYHAHNVDRMSLEQRFGIPNKAVYGDSITADVSRAEAQKYEKNNPEFKAWAEEIYAITKWQRAKLVEKGVISQETADLWEKMYPHYVPITRKDAKGANVYVPLDTNKTGVNAPIKRAVGGSSDIEPMLNTIAQRIEQTYRAIARNDFGIELKNTLGTTLEGQQNAVDVDGIIETLEDQDSKLLKPGTMNSNPTFTVFENGERVEFEITEELYDSLRPAGKVLGHRFENSDKAVVRGVGKALEARRNLLTNWNPVFAWYRNPIKDIQDVAINSQHPMRTYLNIPNAFVQLATNGELAQEYHANGGKANTFYDSRKNEFVKENGIKKLFGKYEAAGEFIEELPRLAEYIASRKNGRSVERSMLDAARVTTNFAAGGDFTKFLNSHGFTFLNASVQGASQHVRNFRESYHTKGAMGVVKTLAKYVVAGIPTIVLNSLRWDDDEEYEELNDYVKQNYYVLWKTDDGKFVRIPKGRTAAVMGELMQQMENLATGDDEVDFSTFFELFMNNIAPSNPLENNVIAPILQTLTNTAWYGGDLVPSRLQKLPAEEQFDESTDSISKWLGEKTGTSPYKWNYLIDQYSGGLGDVFLPMMTPEAESGDNSLMGNILAPWKKEITTDKVLNNKNPGDFYDLKDELETKSNSSKATEEDTMRSMYMDSVSWEMSDLYKKKREIQNSNLSDSTKYEQVREIQDRINALAENALNHYNHVSIDGLYSEAGDKRYNKDAESGKWYEIKPKNADGSDNWYYQKEQEVTKALGISYGEYWNNREEYNYAYDKPEQYALSQAVGGYESYRGYTSKLWDISADKDENGKSINGSRKKKVIDYLNDLNIDYYHKIILFKNEYNADDTYNYEIIDYLNGREDIDYQEMEMILKYLGFDVDSEGNITW